jgi:hypothetical protein
MQIRIFRIQELDLADAFVRLEILGRIGTVSYLVSRQKVFIEASLEFIDIEVSGLAVGTQLIEAVLYKDDSYKLGLSRAVYPVSSAPYNIIATPTSFDETLAVGSQVAVLSAADNDSGDTFTYSLTSGVGDVDNQKFSISGSALLLLESANYEVKNSYSIRVKVTDSQNLTFEKSLTLTVNDLNEPPTQIFAFGFPIEVRQNPTFSTIAGTYTLTNTVTSNNSNGGFAQDANGQISWTGVAGVTPSQFSFAQSFLDNQSQQEFSTLLLLEGNPNPTIVAVLSNNDPDIATTSTYSLVSGDGDADNSFFFITGNNLNINTTTDYENKTEYRCRVRATTTGGLFVETPLVIDIVQMPEIPSDIELSNYYLLSSEPSFGTLVTSDPDNFQTHTYSITGGGLAPYFGLSGGSSAQLAATSFVNGSQADYEILIRSTDSQGLWLEKSFGLSYQTKAVTVEAFDLMVPSGFAETSTSIEVVCEPTYFSFGSLDAISVWAFQTTDSLDIVI